MFNCPAHFTRLVNSTWIKTQTFIKLDCGSQYPISPKTNREPTDKCLGRIEGVHLVALGRLEARGSAAASASRGAHLPLSPSGHLSPSPRVPPSAARPCGSRRRDACGRSHASRVATPGRVRCVRNRFNFYKGCFPRDNPDGKDVRYNNIAAREMFESSPWDLQAVCLDSHLVCNIRAQSIPLT